MNARFFMLALVLLFETCTGFAQRTREIQPAETTLHVRVVTENERSVALTLRVELIPASTQATAGETTTNGEGVAEMTIQGGGNFRVRVSGTGIETTTSDMFTIQPPEGSHIEYVKVKLTQPETASVAGGVASAKVYAVPKEATKEFDAGVASLRSRDWNKAQLHFEAAISRYPKFDQAYDDLGIAKQNGGDVAGAKVAYQKAIELNDHNADAQRDLARIFEFEKNWQGAAELLTKSLAVQPNSAGSLTLLAVAQIEMGNLDGAIASAGRVHALEHKSYAMAHFVLARAYELKSQNRDAIAEYQTYLKEEPNGPRAEAARKRLAMLSKAPN